MARDENGRVPLDYAVEHGHKDVARLLIERIGMSADRGKDSWEFGSTLGSAVRFNQVSMLRLLCETAETTSNNFNSKDGENLTALRDAAALGRTRCVEVLLDCQDIDVNAEDDDGETALIIALLNNRIDIATMLL